ncbi:MAG: hypothetical protein ACJAVV_002332 [Alphaproteobacteria bacterium]|jgi:hypothetical protein
MQNKQQQFQVKKTWKYLTVLLAVSALGACSSTQQTATQDMVDEACVSYASNMRDKGETSGSPALLLSAANAMQGCVISPLPSYLSKAETEEVMKVMADTTLTYIKAGALDEALKELNKFETSFPGKDLYLPDYTSFVDTATALLNSTDLSAQRLLVLNISPALRQEIERKQYWLSN